MLLHAPIEWYVVGLGPSTERVEEEDWFLVTTFFQLLGGVGHQEGVAVVDWVTELEDEDGISAELFEASTELERGLSVLVHTVVPGNSVKSFDVTTAKPVTLFVDHLDMWMVDGV